MKKILIPLIAATLCSISFASPKATSVANANLPLREYHVYNHQYLSFKASHDIYLNNTTNRQVQYNWTYQLCIKDYNDIKPILPCYTKSGSLSLSPNQTYRESHESHVEANFINMGAYIIHATTSITGEFPASMKKDAMIIVQ